MGLGGSGGLTMLGSCSLHFQAVGPNILPPAGREEEAVLKRLLGEGWLLARKIDSFWLVSFFLKSEFSKSLSGRVFL